MTTAEFAGYLTAELGWEVTAEALAYWEDADAPPGDLVVACEAVTGAAPAVAALLDGVPNSFAADTLAGPWVTVYEFAHAGKPMVHADIATVTAGSDRHVRAVNHPPEPRTEGRANPFRNEIAAELVSRHLIGHWKNTSDARYFGSLHLAVAPGETAMEGYYTGFASDVQVSFGWWRWARLDPGGEPLDGLVLREPSCLRDLLRNRSPSDAPLSVADIREDAR
jgi:hypothetical protein